ncbi:hypothetical protein BCR34DRAFT_606427 [Clohesyomyces aquaticus]|uniref:Uncharacterized protein n=1 Tax=Clohesyomyces aquaticus TaxID=1231657 RepID=A0A1Y1YPT5_9PLEO|nr:hypothetical protein BCR34DRAFT_606427 [Clohesyomyces aquaticus]
MADKIPPTVKYPFAKDEPILRRAASDNKWAPTDNIKPGPQIPVQVVTKPSEPDSLEVSFYGGDQGERHNGDPRSSPSIHPLGSTVSTGSWENDSLFARDSLNITIPEFPSPPSTHRITRWPAYDFPEATTSEFEAPQKASVVQPSVSDSPATLFPRSSYSSLCLTESHISEERNLKSDSPLRTPHLTCLLSLTSADMPVTAVRYRTSGVLPKEGEPKKAQQTGTKNSKSPHQISSFIQRLQDIHNDGPSSESQKVWAGIQRIRKVQQAKSQGEKQRERFYEQKVKPERSLPKSPPTKQDKVWGFPYNVSSPDKVSPLLPHALSDGKGKRRVSKLVSEPTLSPSSLAVPLVASASVHYDAVSPIAPKKYADITKPLPPVPQLTAAPKSRRKNTTPSRPPPSPPSPRGKGKSPGGNFLSVPEDSVRKCFTLEDVHNIKPNRKSPRHRGHGEEAEIKQGESITSHSGRHEVALGTPNVSPNKHKEIKADKNALRRQEKLKAKISAPLPMVSPVPFTSNVDVKNGGVGGPGAAISLSVKNGHVIRRSPGTKLETEKKAVSPHTPPSRPLRPSVLGAERKSPTQHGIHFADLLSRGRLFHTHIPHSKPRKRSKSKDSDMSFGCRGLVDGGQAALTYLHFSPRPSPLSQDRTEDHSPSYRSATPIRPKHRPPKPRPPKLRLPVRAADIQQPGPSEQIQAQSHERPYDQIYAQEPNGLKPAPLFSGGRSGCGNRSDSAGAGDSARGKSVVRDTNFYRPYDDVLQEYDGQG